MSTTEGNAMITRACTIAAVLAATISPRLAHAEIEPTMEESQPAAPSPAPAPAPTGARAPQAPGGYYAPQGSQAPAGYYAAQGAPVPAGYYEAPATGVMPMPAAAPAPAPVPEGARRGHFSAGRMVVEMLAGGVLGSLLGYEVYNAAGGSVGGVLAGLGTEIAVEPLIVYGTGRAMGGIGTVGSAYLGGMLAFSGPAATPGEAEVSFAIGMALMPVTSALAFELSSHTHSKALEQAASGLTVTPVVGTNGVSGVKAGVGFSF
jgi:hypothetical protein